MDLNMDGIPDEAQITMTRKQRDQDGIDQIMTAKWTKGTIPAPGSAYAGEFRGGLTGIGRQAADNAGAAGADREGMGRAGVMAEREYNPVSMMTPTGSVMGRAQDVERMMDARETPFLNAPTTNAVNKTMAGRGRDFEERSAQNLRIMTGGRTSGGPLAGTATYRAEQAARSAQVMDSAKYRPGQRKTAAGAVERFMDEEESAKSRISNQQIQTILSAGKIEEARYGMEGDKAQADAERSKAEQASQTRIDVANIGAEQKNLDRESRERMARERNDAYVATRRELLESRKETNPQRLREILNRFENKEYGGGIFDEKQTFGQYLSNTYDMQTGTVKPGAQIDITKESNLDAVNELRERLGMPPLFQRAEDRSAPLSASPASPAAAAPGTPAPAAAAGAPPQPAPAAGAANASLADKYRRK